MSNKPTILNQQLYDYLLKVSLRESKILQELRKVTSLLPESNLQISPDQGQLLNLLCRILKAESALEIGTFTGYSSICIAEALPAKGKLVTCDISDEWTSIARKYWAKAGLEHKIELRLAPAIDTLEQLIKDKSSFDLVFIDADKENIMSYYENSLKLLRQGGLMIIDNVFWSGKVASKEKGDHGTNAIRKLNLMIKKDPRIYPSMIPVADGITLCLKK